MIVLKIIGWIILFLAAILVCLYLRDEYQQKKLLTKNGHYDRDLDGDYNPQDELGI